jgi:hypothetical protein
MLLDCLLGVGVHHGCLGSPAGDQYPRGYFVDRRKQSAGQEDRRTLAGERPGHRATQRSSGSVDHGVSPLQQHFGHSPLGYKDPPGQTRTAGKIHRPGWPSWLG